MKKKLLIIATSVFSVLLSTKGIAQVPTASFSVSNGTVCVGEQIQVTDLSTDSPDAWSYTLDVVATSTLQNPAITFTSPGVYTISLIASNINGASSEATQTVLVNALPVISVASSTAVCLGDQLTLSASGAASYTWTGGVTNGAAFTPTASAAYTVSGTDANGCVNTAMHVVNVNTPPSLALSGNATVCLGAVVSQTVSGATSYTWSNGSNGVVLNDVPAVSGPTQYIVSGTDANGCSATTTINAMVNPLPSVAVNSGTICSGTAFVISPSGASLYTINGGSFTVSPTSDANYTITGTDANGCNAMAVSSISVSALPILTVNSGAVCSGNNFTISPSGATTYTVSGGNLIVNPSTTTSYSVTGTDASGCVSSAPAVATVTVFNTPVVSVNSGSVCAGDNFTISASGASSYTFSGGANIVSPSVTTIYTVTGESTDGCVSSQVVSTVSVFALPVISVNSGSICAGDNFTLNPVGAASYTISGGSNIVSPSNSTVYTITGTDAQGCVSSTGATASVMVVALPVVSVNSGSICSGNNFTISPSGAATYTISGGNLVVNPSTTTSYSVTGTNASGCVSSAPAVASVTVFTTPIISVNSGSVCAGGNYTINASGASNYTFSSGASVVSPTSTTIYTVTGESNAGCVSIPVTSTVSVLALPVVSVNSGTICAGSTFSLTAAGALTYTITGGSSVVNPASTTSYSVMGTDASGCVSSAPAVATVSVFALPVISVNSGSVCAGSAFTIVPTGANAYTISGGLAIVSPSSTTSYSVTGTDLNGCVSASAAVANVTVYTLPTVSITANSSICSGASATLAAYGALSYVWNTAATTASIMVSPASSTSYTVAGTDINGCVGTSAHLLTVNPLPTITVNGGAICPGNQFVLTPGGASSYTFSGGSATVTPLATSNYTITGSDANGCVALLPAIATVSVVNTLTVTISGNTTICNGQTANLTAGGAATYSWSNGANTNTLAISPSATSNYTVTGVSGSCSNTAVVSIVVNPLPVVSVNSGSVCAGNTFTMVPAGAMNYTFSSGSATVTPVTTSTYTVTGSDANGCNAATAAIATVVVNALPVLNVSGSSSMVCAGESATLTVSGANTYSWSQGNTTSVVVINPALTTTYVVTGTDQNFCSNSTVFVQNVSDCVGLSSNVKGETGYVVYPNPNNGRFSVSLSQDARVSVINSLGQTLLAADMNEGQHDLNMESYQSGVYFVQFYNGGNTKTIKVIKH